MSRTLNDFQKTFIQLKNAEPVYIIEIKQLINSGNQYGYLATRPISIGGVSCKDVLTESGIKLTPNHADIWDNAKNKIPQLTFEINNASNIAKEILGYNLINTRILYHIIDNTALVAVNLLTLFEGKIKSINYNNNKITFKCVLTPQLYNKVIPATEFTKEEYPNIETKFIGQPKQVVYGDYMTPSGDDVSSPSRDFYLKKGCRFTVPSIMVDKANYKYVFAGHEVANFNNMTIHSGVGSSMIIRETGNDQLIKIYDPGVESGEGESGKFTLSDEAQLQGYIQPSEYYGPNEDEVYKVLDSDGLLAGKFNETYAELGSGYHLFKFENFDLSSDYYLTNIRLVADVKKKVSGNSGFSFVIKTDGEQKRWNGSDVTDPNNAGEWVDETEEDENTPTVYQVICQTLENQNPDGFNNFTVIKPNTQEYESTELFWGIGLENRVDGIRQRANQDFGSHNFHATYFPLHNIEDYLSELDEDDRNTRTHFDEPWYGAVPSGRFINFERLSQFQFGVYVPSHLHLKNFYLQFHGVKLKGGRKITKVEYIKTKAEVEEWKPTAYGMKPKIKVIPQHWDTKVSEEESQSRSNQSDVLVTPKGRKAGSWASGRTSYGYAANGELIESPVQIIESLLRDEMNLATSNIDVDSFNIAGAQRKPVHCTNWAFWEQWFFAGYINKKVEITKVISQIASQCGLRVFLFNSKWYCKVWDWWHTDFDSFHQIVHTFDKTNISANSLNFELNVMPVNDAFEINYGYSADINDYKMETLYANRNGTNWNPSPWFISRGYTATWMKNKCITAHNTHNQEIDNTKFNKKIINANWIVRPQTANNLLYYYTEKCAKPWAGASFKTDLIGLKLMPGDAICIDYFEFIPNKYNNKKYEVESVSPPDTNNEITISAICTEI